MTNALSTVFQTVLIPMKLNISTSNRIKSGSRLDMGAICKEADTQLAMLEPIASE